MHCGGGSAPGRTSPFRGAVLSRSRNYTTHNAPRVASSCQSPLIGTVWWRCLCSVCEDSGITRTEAPCAGWTPDVGLGEDSFYSFPSWVMAAPWLPLFFPFSVLLSVLRISECLSLPLSPFSWPVSHWGDPTSLPVQETQQEVKGKSPFRCPLTFCPGDTAFSISPAPFSPN